MAEKTKSSQAIRELTEQIEARKRQQELVRTAKQKQKESQERRQRFERLTAPILLVVTVLISAVVLLFF
jgi:cytoskeletal protein RodZ